MNVWLKIGAPVLRSITPISGALVGGLGVAVPMILAGIAEMKVGRPSSTAGLIFPFAIFWGAAASAVGAGIGRAVADVVRRRSWAGPADWRIVSVAVVCVVTVPSVYAVRAVLELERFNAPRVIESTGAIARSPGGPVQNWSSSGELLWKSRAQVAHHVTWNGAPVTVTVSDDALVTRAEDFAPAPINLAGHSYVYEVYGLSATPQGGSSEWLVLLVRLRPTARRELLVILDHSGRLAHLELLERRGRTPRTILWTEHPKMDRQEIRVNLGAPLRYTAVTR